MKITVCNLRSIENPETIDINGKMVLCGKNGAGKSTIVLTPYFVMTGKKLSVRNGAKEGYGTISFDGIEITRYKQGGNSSIKFNGKACSEKAMYEELQKRGYNPDVLCALFDTETRLDGETVLKVASMKLGVDKVLGFTNLVGNELALVSDYFKNNGVDTITIPAIDKAYKKFYSQRTEVNRIVKSAKSVLDENSDCANIALPDIKALTEELSVNSSNITELVAKKFEAERNRELAEKNKTEIKNLTVKLAELKGKKILYTKTDVEKLEEEIRKCKKKREELSVYLFDSSKLLAKLRETVAFAIAEENNKKRILEEKEALIAVLETTSVCPLYAGMKCSTDKTEIIEKLKKEIEQLRYDIQQDRDIIIANGENEIAKTEKEMEETEKEQKECDELLKTLEAKLRTVSDEIQSIEMNNREIERLSEMIKEKEEELKSIPVINEDVIDEAITTHRKESELIRNRIVNATIMTEKKQKYDKQLKEYEEVSALSHSYSLILTELQQLPNKIFEKIVVPIEKSLNDIISVLKPDWTLKFNITGSNLSILIGTPNGVIDIEELSTGEKIIANYIFKVLICNLINFDTLLLDNTDALDEDNYKKVEEVVSKATQNTLLVNCGDVDSILTKIKK